jgi:hypothetical protein
MLGPFTVIAGLFYVYTNSLLILWHTAEWQRDTERQIHENERARLDYLSEVIHMYIQGEHINKRRRRALWTLVAVN